MNPVPYTLQTAFDTVLAGIRSQGHRASVKQRNDDILAAICQYRGLGGRKCAFGWLLPDSLVNPKWDDGAGTTAAHLLHHGGCHAPHRELPWHEQQGEGMSGSIILLLQFAGILAAALLLSWLLDKVFPHWEEEPDKESWVNVWKDQA